MGQIVNIQPGENDKLDIKVDQGEKNILQTKCKACSSSNSRSQQNGEPFGPSPFCSTPHEFELIDFQKAEMGQDKSCINHGDHSGRCKEDFPKHIKVRLNSLKHEKPREKEEAAHEASKAMFEDEVATRLSLRPEPKGGAFRCIGDTRTSSITRSEETDKCSERSKHDAMDWKGSASQCRSRASSACHCEEKSTDYRSLQRAKTGSEERFTNNQPPNQRQNADYKLHRGQLEESFLNNQPPIQRLKGKAHEWRELRDLDQDKVLMQAEGKVRQRAQRETQIMEMLGTRAATMEERRARVRAEVDARGQQKRAQFYATSNQLRKQEEIEGRFAYSHLCFSGSEIARKRREEDLAEERRLQKRALFHFEALRKIEESYMQRKQNFKSILNRAQANSRFPITSRCDLKNTLSPPNQKPQHSFECMNNFDLSSLSDFSRSHWKKPQKRGKGGLNALLTPVPEEELSDEFQDLGMSSPDHENSLEVDNVVPFQRIRKVERQAAEEKRAAIEQKTRERRAQLKAAMERAERARALSRLGEQRGPKRNGECSRSCYCEAKSNIKHPSLQSQSCTPHLASQNPYMYNYSESLGKQIKEVNEMARSRADEEESERERRKRERITFEERWSRIRPSREDSLEFYQRLSTPKQRVDKFESRTPMPVQASINRFKSPLDGTQQHQVRSRFNTPSPIMYQNSKFIDANGVMRSALIPQKSSVLNSDAMGHSGKWEQESKFSQASKAGDQDLKQDKAKIATIHEEPVQCLEIWKTESQDHDQGMEFEKEDGTDMLPMITSKSAFSSHNQNLSSTSNSQPQAQPRPDHYNSIEDDNSSEPTYPQSTSQAIVDPKDWYNAVEEDCTCESKISSRRERSTGGLFKERYEERVKNGADLKGGRNHETKNWLGKFYSSITSSLST